MYFSFVCTTRTATGLAQHFTLCSFILCITGVSRSVSVHWRLNCWKIAAPVCIISHLQVDFPALMGKAYTGWEWVGAGMAHVYSGIMIPALLINTVRD